MRAAIIDDVDRCRESLRSSLRRYLDGHYMGELPVIEDFTCGEDFLSAGLMKEWDIIFIDQFMTGISGMDIARAIRQKDKLVSIIFVTASRNHAVESYGVRACGYLVKPYAYEDFEKTMEMAGIEKIRKARFICPEGEKIMLHEILWCDRDSHYTQIHTERRGIFRFRIPFMKVAEMLAPYPQFLSCYKGCIVNAERVKYIDGFDFLMDTGVRVPFARREKRKLEELYSSYLFQQGREDTLL
ncbi:LytTR family DNA-binding domain-containing protein [Anaerolentibacter hominis]|uniref:LytR/AlgR family response regulator transcription factor n=1 Tax=Anaerolentibacter hominis TaxID=3079009 RepID=UPI0031B80892